MCLRNGLCSNQSGLRLCGRTGEVALELILAGKVLHGPWLIKIALLSGGMKRPVRIAQVRTGEAAEVGTSGSEDRVDMVNLVNVAHRHRRHADFVADAVVAGKAHQPQGKIPDQVLCFEDSHALTL